jgi:hypothetical protein
MIDFNNYRLGRIRLDIPLSLIRFDVPGSTRCAQVAILASISCFVTPSNSRR